MTMTKQSENRTYTLGYDYYTYWNTGQRVKINAPVQHTICVGSSNSGKTTALLYWLYKMRTVPIPCDLYLMDFKKSHEFRGITNPECYAEFEDCHNRIIEFYEMFQKLPEGGDGRIKILLIDEIAGMLSHYSLSKEGKQKAEEIRYIISSVLMLGRSRKTVLWLSMQRYSASIFPNSSGAADNFGTIVGLGRLTVDGRRGLFAGEHFDGEDKLQYGQGNGIVLMDGQPLRSIIIPRVSKEKILRELQK